MKNPKTLAWESLLLIGTVLILAGTVLTMVSGCSPRIAHAPRDPMTAVVQRDEAPAPNGDSNRYLTNVKFFLWPEEMSSHSPVVGQAVTIAGLIDDLDTKGFSLSREKADLERTLKPLADAEAKVVSTQKKIDNAQISLNRELGKSPPNQTIVTRLQTQIAQFTTQLETDKAEAAKQLALIDPIPAGETMGPKRKRQAQLVVEQDDNKVAGEALVAQITTLVYWYKTQPSSVALGFLENSKTGALEPFVRINKWALFKEGEIAADQKSYDSSTDLGADEAAEGGTITNVSYQTRGAVFRFDLGVFESPVVPQSGEEIANPALARARAIRDAMNGYWVPELKEVYSFKFGRIRYDKTEDPKDGRVFFGGSMDRRRDPNGRHCEGFEREVLNCLRQGSVKLVDRSN